MAGGLGGAPRVHLRNGPFGSASSMALTRRLVNPMWFAAATLVAFMALFLIERRLAGALVAPLGGATFLAASLALIVLVAAVQAARPGDVVAKAVLALICGVALVAVTLPGSHPWAVSLAWFTFVVVEAVIFLMPRKISSRSASYAPVASTATEVPAEGEHLVQRITRKRSGSGGELLEAVVSAPCHAGDRLAVVHLAFCPPLDAAPALAACVREPADATARITLSESYGARIEVRLPEPAPRDLLVLMEVTGEAGPAQVAED